MGGLILARSYAVPEILRLEDNNRDEVLHLGLQQATRPMRRRMTLHPHSRAAAPLDVVIRRL